MEHVDLLEEFSKACDRAAVELPKDLMLRCVDEGNKMASVFSKGMISETTESKAWGPAERQFRRQVFLCGGLADVAMRRCILESFKETE